MGFNALLKMIQDVQARVQDMTTSLPNLAGTVDAMNSRLAVGRDEAEGYAAMTLQLTTQLKVGAGNLAQVAEDFGVMINGKLVPGFRDLQSELHKTLGQIEENQEALARLAVDFATHKKSFDEVLAAIAAGSPEVAKLVEDLVTMSKSAKEAFEKLEQLRVGYARKNDGGSPLDSILQQLQQAVQRGDLADQLGRGLTGGRL